jgi:WD40 repeat protein
MVLFSASSDSTIKVWNTDNGQCLRTFKGHIHYVSSLICFNQFLLSGGDDKTIRLWSLDNPENKCVNVLKGHTGCVLCFAIKGQDWLISGGGDGAIKKWSLEKISEESNDCLIASMNNTSMPAVRALLIDNDGDLISGGDDKLIYIFDLNNFMIKKIVNVHSDFVYCFVIFDKDHFLSGSAGNF